MNANLQMHVIVSFDSVACCKETEFFRNLTFVSTIFDIQFDDEILLCFSL